MKRILVAMALLTAGLFLATPARADSFGFHIFGGRGGFSFDYREGYGPRHYPAPIYRDPCYRTPNCGPVYRVPDCDDYGRYGCGPRYDYHPPIRVHVFETRIQNVRVWDDYRGCYVIVPREVSFDRYVTAYWDNYYGGYYYYDSFGNQVRVR